MFRIEFEPPPPSIPISLCPPIAQDVLRHYLSPSQKVYGCEVYKFESSPELYLVYSDYDFPKSLIVIKEGNKLTPLDTHIFDTHKLNAKLNITDSLFNYGFWITVVNKYKEVNWDLVKTPSGYNLVILINNYRVPNYISSSKTPLTYSTRRLQYILDGKISINLSDGELDLSSLVINTKNYPINQMSKNYCDLVISRTEKENCFSALGQILQDLSLCQKITRFDDLKNECLTGIAKSSKKPNVCNLITKNFDKDKCYEVVGKSADDVEICLNITWDLSRGDCIYKIAKSSKNIDVCNRIDKADRRIKNNCIGAVAEATQNSELCFGIDEDEIKGDCFFNIAVSTKNSSICMNIPLSVKNIHDTKPETLRDWCFLVSD